MVIDETRKKDIIKHLGREYIISVIYDENRIEEAIQNIANILIEYKIGVMADPFVFTEKEYLWLYKFVSEEYYDMFYRERKILLSYKIDNFNEDNYYQNYGLPIFNELYFIDDEDNLMEMSDSYEPKVSDVKLLLEKFKTIKFGKFNNNDLEWIALEENEKSYTLLLKYLIDDKKIIKYDKEYDKYGYMLYKYEFETPVRESYIYKYLNNDFYNNAFNEEEKKKIIKNRYRKVDLPSFGIINENLQTDYLELCEPCLTDFGVAGINEDDVLAYILNINNKFGLIEDNGIFVTPILNDDDSILVGIRPMIKIRK